MQELNIGSFIYSIINTLLDLGRKLYQLFTMQVSITWVRDILSFFGANIDGLPNEISLYWVLTSASALTILVLIIYRIFK